MLQSEARTLPPDESGLGAIRTVAEFRLLDEGEVLEGYLDGVHGACLLAEDRSRSYWHGWRNGMIDRGDIAVDESTIALRRAFDDLRKQG